MYITRYNPLKISTDDVGSSQWWRRLHDWADVIHADFQMVISRYLQNINTYLFCTAERMLRTIIMQNFRLINACFLYKSTRFESTDFASRYDWWRRLQPTSSVSPVWWNEIAICFPFSNKLNISVYVDLWIICYIQRYQELHSFLYTSTVYCICQSDQSFELIFIIINTMIILEVEKYNVTFGAPWKLIKCDKWMSLFVFL